MKNILSFDLRKIFIFLVFFLEQLPVASAEDRNLLTKNISLETLQEIIIPADLWHPYPKIDEPKKWQVVPLSVRQAHIQQGEAYLGSSWDSLPATVFLEFVRNGNRSNYEKMSFSRREHLAALVMAEVFENKGRFLDDIVNGLWAICEETFWGVPAHVGRQKAGPGLPDVTEPIVDLFAAETGTLLAWTDYLLDAKLNTISALIKQRLTYEIDRRILTPNLDREDFGWMGFVTKNINNWNPWINSNWLTAILLVEKDEQRRLNAVHKCMRSLDNFINIYPADGGCDEGPTYWSRAGASLFDSLELLFSASNGQINIFDQMVIKEIGRYIYKAHINDNYFINFADASGKMSIDPAVVFRFGRSINDPIMMGFAAWSALQKNYGSSALPGSFGIFNRQLPAFFILNELTNYPPQEPLLRDFFLSDLQVFGARSNKSNKTGFYVAAKGGHNAESHNHNDVGNFIIYADGMPLLIDVGVGTYTAKTFSSLRYDIWTMQSAYHNLPTINGVMQMSGRQYAAKNVSYQAKENVVEFALDIATAYPPQAEINSWLRTIRLNRNKNVEIIEKYQLTKWKQPVELNYMTPLPVEIVAKGLIKFTAVEDGKAKDIFMNFDPQKINIHFDKIPLDDAKLQASWGNQLTRILLQSSSTLLTDELNIVFYR